MSTNNSLFDRTVRAVEQCEGKLPTPPYGQSPTPTVGGHVPDNQVNGELQYLYLVARILKFGNTRGDRTGTGTHSIFGPQMTFDISKGRIPLLTTKTVNIRPIIRELLWFLSGSTNNNDLDAKIWDQWAAEDGDLGPIYGKQWRSWDDTRIVPLDEWVEGPWENRGYQYVNEYYDPGEGGTMIIARRHIDQIADIIQQLTQNPDSRRMVVTGWNPAVLPTDQTWEYAHHPEGDGWEEMSSAGRALLAWRWGHNGRHGSGGFDDKILDELDIPTHFRRCTMSPQENVAHGNAALPACHTMFQFYTRELDAYSRVALSMQEKNPVDYSTFMDEDLVEFLDERIEELHRVLDSFNVPRRSLSCKLYQR